ncbi:MAG: EAL domain-containing protein [Myxococcota bacterium]
MGLVIENEPVLASAKGRVLVVDDEGAILKAYRRALSRDGHEVVVSANAASALDSVRAGQFDVVVSDIAMPGMSGVELLRAVRAHDLDVSVILITGGPTVETAAQAVELGALRYLVKPGGLEELRATVSYAVRVGHLARLKRQALDIMGDASKRATDRAGLDESLTRAIAAIWMSYQPIVSWSQRAIVGYEALVRSREPALPHPGALFDAAERLERLVELGRAIRTRVAQDATALPGVARLFVNLHPQDLLDEDLYRRDAPLSAHATRVVLEVTERASLHDVTDAAARFRELRALGYRLAIDDLGAGYAGLTSFAMLEPDVAKIDMSLVRDVDRSDVRLKLVQSMAHVCSDLGTEVISEGVETAAERDALVSVGCDIFQGYLFAKPGPAFPSASF